MSGRLGFDTVPELWKAAGRLFQGPARLVVDLREVSGADSAGLALLVEWLREARRRGASIHFENLPAQLQAIAQVSRLPQLFAHGVPKSPARPESPGGTVQGVD